MTDSEHKQPYCEKHDRAMVKNPTGFSCALCAAEHLSVLHKADRETEEVQRQQDEVSTRRQLKQKRLDMVGIPPRFRKRKLNDYKAETPDQKKALSMVAAYGKRLLAGEVCGGLVLYGDVGTGKTHMACALAAAFENLDKVVLFTSVADMISKIRESYGNNDITELQAIREFRDLDLLVLDEVGVQKGDVSEINLLTRVIDARYGWEKPTILLSNFDLKQLGELLGKRIIDRLCEDGGMLVYFNWESFRSQAASLHRA